MSHRDFIAMQAMMKYEPVAHYDSGEDGIFPRVPFLPLSSPLRTKSHLRVPHLPLRCANHINMQTHPLDSCVCQSYSKQRR